jgi:hypothetical protein
MFNALGVARQLRSIALQLDTAMESVQGSAPLNVLNEAHVRIDWLKKAASDLGSAKDAAQAKPILNDAAANASAVLAMLAALPLPPQATAILRIVQVLLPAMLAIADIVWPPA